MYSMVVTVDRFENGRVVLLFEDGQQVVLPKRKLPGKIKEGSVLYCEFFRAEDHDKRREDIARYLLEEILHPHGKTKEDS